MVSKKTLLSKKVKTAKRAVVDIGSNSVRLVIYDGFLRAPMPICNEKALCGLGRDLNADGSLNPDAVKAALETLTRFRRILKVHGDPTTTAIATSAVREAKDGKKFVSAVRKIGIDVSVISGAEEAELAALGVLSYEPGATGIAGDLGGGSLELISLKDGEMGDTVSLKIGPLTLMQATNNNLKEASKVIDDELAKVSFLGKKSLTTLYAVGGAWRALAKIQMQLRRYPLSVLHHFELSDYDALEVCNLIAGLSRRSLEEIPGIPRRRIDTLPYAAVVLRKLIEHMSAESVMVSAGGIREGLLFRDLDNETKKHDPFLDACRFYARRLAPAPDYGRAALKVVSPLFKDAKEYERLRLATTSLMDIGAFFHPDLRGRFAFDTAMWAPFVGVSHKERIWTALALFRRYSQRPVEPQHDQVISILTWDEQNAAMQMGLALRFVATFSPKVSAPLKGCKLSLSGGKLTFQAPENRREMMGESPRKRLALLAAAFEAEPVEVFT
ncbi:MAG: Ppx/GppA family phosphatase [Marinicaulis sp.]|nr:Ppx/GppA family phosphatase [Marinicaulis sp.]NNE42038.1 Ppx/GppA family phosphatase [Marinicaulis sp.]